MYSQMIVLTERKAGLQTFAFKRGMASPPPKQRSRSPLDWTPNERSALQGLPRLSKFNANLRWLQIA